MGRKSSTGKSVRADRKIDSFFQRSSTESLGSDESIEVTAHRILKQSLWFDYRECPWWWSIPTHFRMAMDRIQIGKVQIHSIRHHQVGARSSGLSGAHGNWYGYIFLFYLMPQTIQHFFFENHHWMDRWREIIDLSTSSFTGQRSDPCHFPATLADGGSILCPLEFHH